MENTAPHPHPPKRRFLRFRQLKEMGVASDYAVLNDLIKKRGFPPGFKLSHKVLIFDEDEVLAWLETKRRSAA
jgi:predicted DNA-binding transcriptional regulator AlpA